MDGSRMTLVLSPQEIQLLTEVTVLLKIIIGLMLFSVAYRLAAIFLFAEPKK